MFLTGQQEVETLCSMLRQHFEKRKARLAKRSKSVKSGDDELDADISEVLAIILRGVYIH